MRPECPSIFLTSTAFVDTKAMPREKRGKNIIFCIYLKQLCTRDF